MRDYLLDDDRVTSRGRQLYKALFPSGVVEQAEAWYDSIPNRGAPRDLNRERFAARKVASSSVAGAVRRRSKGDSV